MAIGGVRWWTRVRFEEPQRLRCQSNLRQLALVFAWYHKDFQGGFPLAIVAGPLNRSGPASSIPLEPAVGWADVMAGAAINETLLYCPSAIKRHSPNPAMNDFTDFWMNGNLSGQNEKDLVAPNATLLLGDGNDGTDQTDASYSISQLPERWLHDSSMPPWRHLGGANYLYADGHVAWQRPDKVTRNYGRADCFAAR